jgi:alpha-glucosidase
MPTMDVRDEHWWQIGVVYQIYPRSFADSNGDGVGDLRGIIGRLDYLTDLGVDALWISPVYPSPMADFGYDVADFCDIDSRFGTLADLDALVAAAHERGLRLILDFVPNHTSDEHPWFLSSRRSRDDPKRDWYLWQDAAPNGGPPNNWQSHFGGPAWTWDVGTRQYYLHSFLPQQPDLNWRNPDVRRTMYDVLRFWLDRGIDGFRVDVLWLLIKDARFRDNPVNPAYVPARGDHDRFLSVFTADRPEVQTIVAEMRAVLDAYGDRVLIGEIYLPVKRLVAYYGRDLTGAQLPFNFQLVDAVWNAHSLAEIIRSYEAALPPGAWPNWVLGNHDKPRIASRVGLDQARVAAMLLLTLRGTPTLYYGDEIGMTDVPIPLDRVRDPAEIRQPGIGQGRDPERTPMQWDASPGGGFSAGVAWLPLGDHVARNVVAQTAEPQSMLALYRHLLALRRSTPALRRGSIAAVEATGNVLQYVRSDDAGSLTILLNLGPTTASASARPGRLVLSTYLDRNGEAVIDGLDLRPAEGVIVSHSREHR